MGAIASCYVVAERNVSSCTGSARRERAAQSDARNKYFNERKSRFPRNMFLKKSCLTQGRRLGQWRAKRTTILDVIVEVNAVGDDLVGEGLVRFALKAWHQTES